MWIDAGGTALVLDHFAVRQLSTSRPAEAAAIGAGAAPVSACRAGQAWHWDGVEFEVLSPAPPLSGDDNEDSCVLRVRAGGAQLLLPADIGLRTERRLLAAGADLRAQVLVAGHHGSRTSTGAPWLQAVAPQWVLYAAGYRNRYGFPAAEVHARVRAHGARTAGTATGGALRVDFDPAGGPPRLSRQRRARDYWRAATGH